MFRSRRRSREFRFTEADMRMRAALGDANIIAWYDARFPWTITLDTGVSAWADARRASGLGPTLAQTTDDAQPVYSASARTVTFDGTNDYLRIASATFNAITGAGTLIYVGTLPETGVPSECMVAIGTSANAHIIRSVRDGSNGSFRVRTDTDDVPQISQAAQAGTHVFFGSRTASSGGNVTAAASIDGAAGGTSAGAAADATWHTLTVGANNAATAATFADTPARAVLVVSGTLTLAQREAVTAWARAAHGVA